MPSPAARREVPTASHFGTYLAETDGTRLLGLRPDPADPEPSPIGLGVPSSLTAPSRLTRPHVRRGYLEHGPGPASGDRGVRGTDPYVPPSGRIEIVSDTIGGFALDDCPAHPTWLEPAEWLGSPAAARFPLHLLSGQPDRRLHSQFDNGSHSRAGKVAGREPVTINPVDAAARGITDGAVVRIHNDRGRLPRRGRAVGPDPARCRAARDRCLVRPVRAGRARRARQRQRADRRPRHVRGRAGTQRAQLPGRDRE